MAQALERSIAKDDARAWLKIEALHYLEKPKDHAKEMRKIGWALSRKLIN